MRKTFTFYLFFTFFFQVFVYAQTIVPTGGIVYVKSTAAGNGNGSSWDNATADLQGAIDASGVQKVFVAKGTYSAPANGFKMKNNVAIYGGFDPGAGIVDLTGSRHLPNQGSADASKLDGGLSRSVINNVFTAGSPLTSTAILDGFSITNGKSATNGGGVHNEYASPVLTNLTFRNNLAVGKGGAMYNENSNPQISNTTMSSNLSNSSYTGSINPLTYNAVYNVNSVPVLTNVYISEPSVRGAYGQESGSSTLINVTLIGDVDIGDYAGMNYYNTIVSGNHPSNNYTADHSYIKGKSSTANGNLDGTLYTAADLFNDPAQGNYFLKSTSPAIDAGNNASFPGLNANTKDAAGNKRLNDENIDMGAYESPLVIKPGNDGTVYVKATATGTGTGNSWANATSDLQGAIDAAGVQKVFVSRGTYYGANRGFKMKNNVAIYGGFNPEIGIVSLNDARIMPNPANTQGSILSGNNERAAVYNTSTLEAQMNTTAVLDGFTITGGNNWGGIYNSSSSPTFNNLVIRGNYSSGYGGGINNFNASPVFNNIIVKDNSCSQGGAAMYNANGSPVITNGLFINDGSVSTVIYQQSGTAVLNNCTVIGYSGGAYGAYSIYIYSDGSITFNNSIVAGGLGLVNNNYTANHSLIQGNNDTSNGNINAAGIPLGNIFVNPPVDDYRLTGTSVARNAGSNALYPGFLNGNTKDLAGTARLDGSTIDMGAYEFSHQPGEQGIIYVKPNSTGNGSSWAEASGDLQGAINAAGAQKVFVAKGTYTVGADSYIMKNGVAIYGGFDPDKGISDLTHNRIMPGLGNQGSILSGNNTRPVIWNEDNGLTATAILDGFTITAAKGNAQGAIYNKSSSPTLNNLLITGNTTSYVISNSSASPVLTNVSITGNSGLGVYQSGGAMVMNNVTVAGNAGYSLAFIFGGTITAKNSIICGAMYGSGLTNQSSLVDLTAQIPAGLFTDPANGNYIPVSSSSAVNGGNNALFPNLDVNTSKDLAGNLRVFNGTIDQGAYEYRVVSSAGHIAYVKTMATGTGDGSSWDNATSNLQGAIDAQGTQQVYVAKGTYTVGASSYIMKSGVAIYGGFDPANGITELSHNRIMPGAGGGSVLNGNNQRPVIWNVNNGLTASAILDGFTLTGSTGAANQGTIYNESASPTLRNLLITANNTAGIFNSLSSPVLTNVAITQNTGIGIDQIGGTTELNNVTIAGNGSATRAITANSVFPNVPGAINAKNSLVYGSISGTFNNNNSFTESSGYTAAQVFANPAAGNYQLIKGSPAINAGNNSLYAGLDDHTKDLSGKSRLTGATIDMGAYEYEYQAFADANGIVYVRTSPTGTGDGSSWDNATADLQSAINGKDVQKVFVATGKYTVGDHSFIMKNNVAIYGGFDPANNIKTLNDARILPTRSTAQASELNGNNTRPPIWNDNVGLTPTAILDGFLITNGNGSYGGGIYNKYGSPTFNNLLITGNRATRGGGVYNGYGSPAFNNSIIRANTSNYYGGAMCYEHSSSVFTNVLFVGNSAVSGAGGIYDENEDDQEAITFVNVTIANNTSPYNNSLVTYAPFAVKNSIIYGGIRALGGATYTVQSSLIESMTDIANGNLDATGITPELVFNNPASGDYTLSESSPALNKGDNSLYAGLTATTTDLAGLERVWGGKIDLGAYEFPVSLSADANGIIYVKESGSGTNSGNSWANATPDLHGAIDAAGVQKVYVATGNYNVGANSFVMKNGVAIYGGFNPAGNVTDWNTRTLPNKGTGDGSVLNGQNTRPVIWNVDNNLTATAILDGFTVMNGKYANSGGGMYNRNTAPVFNNLVIRNNEATAGGGMYNVNAPVSLSNSIVKNNSAQYGGGIRNNNSAVVLTNVSVTGNSATDAGSTAGGGGIFNETSAAVLTNVAITGNSTNAKGGGFRNLSGNPVLTNVTIANNTAVNNTGAAALYVEAGTLLLNNAVVYGTVEGTYTAKSSLVQGNADLTNNNLDAANVALIDLFTDAANGDYHLKSGAPAVNAGSNSLYAGLDENTKDLAGNARVTKFNAGGIIDLGAYESPYTVLVPDAGGIIYVKESASGDGSGKSWVNATDDLQGAINAAGVQQVFVAKGTYKVGDNSFVMKNGVAVYGGFDPGNGITGLAHNRILPNKGNGTGSVLDGQGVRPVIWNSYSSGAPMDNTAVLDGFTLTNGFTNDSGGGMYNVYASPTLRNLSISNNQAKSTGGGMYNNHSSPLLTNVIIRNNKIESYADVKGGGMYNNASNPVLVNVLLADNEITTHQNTAIGEGGGMYNTYSNPVLINVTIAGNKAVRLIYNNSGSRGGGIFNAYSEPVIYNSIFWANEGTNGTDMSGNGVGTVTVKNSITQSFNTGNPADNNQVGVNPWFTNTTPNDYVLKAGSPAINAGSNTWFTGLDANTLDLAGNARAFDYANGGTIDLGAYESPYKPLAPDANGIMYVKETASGEGTGSSWTDAADNLRMAINTPGVHKIFVAVGNYNIYGSSFILKNGVEIYGGFDPANGITDLSQNRVLPAVSPALVEGSVLNGQNTNPVVWNVFTSGTALDQTAVLDGFTLKNGYNGANGGGMYNVYASPTLKNLLFTKNNAQNGAGIYNSNASPVLSDITFHENTAGFDGGGIYNAASSSPVLTDITISSNTANYGGGMFNKSVSTLLMTGVKIKNNISANDGGGMYNDAASAPVITNTEITGNTAKNGVGIYNRNNSSVALSNVKITDNTSGSNGQGGAIYNEAASSAALTNVTVAGNKQSLSALYTVDGSTSIANSVIYGGINGTAYTTQYALVEGKTATANGNLDATGITAAQVFTDPANGNYTLLRSSPAINAGSNALFAGLDVSTKDLAGNARVTEFNSDGVIDMGAYESAYAPLTPDANGIIYVKNPASGTGSGSDWDNATNDLHGAINTTGVQKVFVAVGNYSVGTSSFTMKNNVEIYGGFDPANNIKILADARILPNRGAAEGAVLNGENARPVIWNQFTSESALNNTAVLDGFTLKNGVNSGGDGGGIRSVWTSAIYRNLVIKNNTAKNGGGIYVSEGAPVFTDLIIQGNTTTDQGGGGIYHTDWATSKITNAVIKGNTAQYAGGGFYNNQSAAPVLTNVLITGNAINYIDFAHGVFNRSGYVELRNVTIAGNIPSYGYNIAIQANGGNYGVYNSIIYGSVYGSSEVTFKQSLIEGKSDTSNGNLDATGISITDVFTNPSAGDYTLKAGAVAIDAGEVDYYAGLDANTKDLAGNARVYQFSGGGVLDLGAYESSFSAFPYVALMPDANGIIYVKETATGDKSGSSWDNATDNLKKSIRVAGVQQVWAAVGTYPAYNLALKNGIAVYGGFDPDNGIVDLTNTRILPNAGTGTQGAVINAQSAGVVILNDNNGVDNTAILDGFTLTGGRNTTGGGMYNNGASPTLRNLWIKGNTVTDDGGGMLNINSSSPVMANVTVSGNAARYGGGIFNRNNSSPVMTNVSIKTNTTSEDGGGMYNDVSASPVMTNVSITGNSAKNGAGMYNRTNSSPVMVNALIANNTANTNGGAIRNEATSSPSLTNVTIANNSGSTTLYVTGGGSTTLNNSIVFGAVSGTYTAQYSFVQGASATTNGNLDATGITAAQVFTDPANGDYRLKPTSPVVDKGSNALYAGLDAQTRDLAGKLRAFDFANGGIIDMGAYEYQPVLLSPDANGILYVNKTVSGGDATGDSWANAVQEFADALNAAKTNTAVKSIYVAKGTYLPLYAPATVDVNNNPVTDRDKAFLLVKDVKVYGGFDPDNGLTDLATRNPQLAITTLSGDLGALGVATDNAHHVVISAGTMGTAALDGFTVSSGYADGGGGSSIYDLKINNINFSKVSGGGIYVSGGSPAISNVNVINNEVMAQGGGMMLKDCTSFITNVTLSGNKAQADGGGIFAANAAPVLTNVLMHHNSASVRGGGMVNAVSAPVLTNVVITNNTGGGLLNHSGSSPRVRNSILYGNAVYNLMNNSAGADNPLISYSLVQGSGGSAAWNSAGSTDGGHNLDVDPQFVDAANNDYKLKVGSPAMNAGDNTVFNPGKTPDISAITTDMAGNQRVLGGIIDLGVYEQADGLTPDANGIIYVKTVAAGNGTGDSWANATANLQAAIDAATSQVWVAKGTYTATPNSFKMKNGIAIYGGFDPEAGITDLTYTRIIPETGNSTLTGGSVLSGGNQHSVIENLFTVDNPLLNTAVLDGFTLSAGAAVNGGGIANTYASPTLRNLLITANTASASGGGIYNWRSSPVLSGIVVSGNTAAGDGGGIYSGYGNLTLSTALVKGNEAGNGGGIYVFDSNNALLTDVAITGNSVTGTNTGSALHSYSGSIRLLNTTIAGNTGNAFYNGATAFIDNSIVYGGVSGLVYTAQYSMIEGVPTADLNMGTSAIAQNQVFSNPAGGDFTLLSSSKAVNAGNNALYAGLDAQTKDLVGKPRLYGTHIDLGVYELQTEPTLLISPDANGILYVNKSVSGGNGSGDSWANALSEVADALQWADNNRNSWTAATPLTIYVAKGTYLPKYRAGVLDNNNNPTTDRDMTFILVKDVQLYGGFDPANGLTDLVTRNPYTAVTTLSGDLGTLGVATDNAYHVVVSAGDAGTARLDGFTISGGNANGSNSVTMNTKSISRNQGGGVYGSSSAPVLMQVRITANSAATGGGLYADDAPLALSNALIDRNSASTQGGGMYNNNAAPVLTNVTISNNTLVTNNGGGALYNAAGAAPQIRNSILFGNALPNVSNSSSTPVISNSLIQGINSSADVNTVFTNASGNDYSLKAGSPAIDAGDNTLFAGLNAGTKDFAGNARVYNYNDGGVIDMGAFESSYTAIRPDVNHIIYVKTTATGTGSGNSWANATADLQGAVNANDVQQVWVATGTYNAPVSGSFVMKNGVAIYGGFDPGAGISDLTHARIIPGATSASFSGGSILKGSGKSVINNQFTGPNSLLNTAILDGFTLKGGNAALYGGGIYNQNASPVLRNLYITGNAAGSDGGAMYNLYASPLITNVLMSGNNAIAGGAMSNNEGSNAVLTNVVIKENIAFWAGGAMYNYNSSPVLINALISDNAADLSGSAVYNEVSASPVFTNVTISNNVNNPGGDESLIVNSYGSSPEFRNSIIYGNTGTLIMNFSPAEDMPVFKYSLIQGSGGSSAWISSTGTDGSHNLDADPLFTNVATGDYTLKTGSPAMNVGSNGLFAGLNAATVDLAGNLRVFDFANGGVLDMGAYETQGAALTQTINPITDVVKTYGDAAFEPGATATSGLTVTYSSSDSNIVEAWQDTADSNKWKLRLKKAGTVTVTAHQPGDATYPAAADVAFTVTVNPKDVTLSFTAAAISKTYNGTAEAPVNAAHLQFAGGDIINSDEVEVQVASPAAVYDTKDAGTGKTITLPVLALSLSGADAANYRIANTVDLSKFNALITPAALSVKANNASKVYDASPYAGGNGVTYTGFVGGEDEHVLGGTLTYSGTSQDAVMAGTYQIMPGGYTSSDYTITFVAGTLTITSNSVNTLSFTAQTTGATLNKVYGDAVINAAATASSGLTVAYQSTNTSVATVDNGGQVTLVGVGTAEIQALQAGDANYDAATTINITVVVAPKPLTITANAAIKTYDGIAYTGGNGVTYTGFVSGEDENVLGGTLTYSGTSQNAINAGTYPIMPGGYTSGNYAITYTGADLTITPKSITVTADAKSKAYGATDPVLTYTVNPALIAGDSFTGALSRAAGEDVGTYPITQGSLSAGANYTLSYTGADFTIGTNIVTVVADAKSKVYGDTDPVLTYTVSGLAPGDALTGALSRAAGNNAGTYSITQGSLSAGAGYTISFTSADFTVTPKAITVTANTQSKVYGDADPTLTYSLSVTLVGSDSFSGSLSRAVGENVGVYAINQGDLALSSNYTLSYTGANLTITPKPVTVTADAKSKSFGATDPVLTYTVNPALVAGDSFTGVLSRTAGEAVGTYSITQGNLSAGANYTISYTGADFTIGTNVVTITANAQSKVYGDADPALTYTVSGLAPGDALTGSLERTSGNNAGTYSITQGSLSAGAGYTINFSSADFTVTPKPITVTASAQSKVYGDTEPTLTYSLSSALVSGDSFTGALSRAAGNNVGIYAINQGDLALNSNYALTYTGADFTITPKAITVTADAKSKAYGATDPVLTYTVNPALIAGDSFTGTLGRTAGESVGTYPITQGNLSAGANYTLSFTSADFTIGTNIVTVVAEAKSKVYGDADPVLTYTVSGLAPGDALTGSLERIAGNNAGTYSITQGNLSAGTGYTINFTGSNLTITPKSITVTANAQSKIYGDADPMLTYSLSSALVTGDSFSGVLSRATGNNVGVYAINQGDLALSSNYTLTYTGADFTITPKAITVVADAKSKAFGTTDPVLTYTVNPALILGDNFSGALSRAAGEAVGTYPITQGNLSAGANYTLSYTGADFTIGTNIVTVVAEAKSKVYGDTDPALTYTVSGLAPGDALTGSLARTAGNDAGTYSITQGSLSAGAGYTINFTGSNLTITPKPITITANTQSKVYGDADPTLTYSLSSTLVSGDNFSGSLSRAAGENVGVYAINQGDLALSSNYTLSYTGANLTITPKPVTVTADAKSKSFGATDPVLTYTVNPALVAGDSFTGVLSRTAGEAVGTYSITQGSLSAGANYTISYTGADFTIGTNVVTITANAQSKVYGETDPVLTYTVSGLAPGDVLTGSLERTSGNNAGTYSITQGSLSAGTGYTINFSSADFTVTPKAITVTANAQSKVYGDTDPALTYSLSAALVGSDSFSGALSRAAGNNVGVYAISQGDLTLSSNYALTYTGANLTITPKSITVTADAKSKAFGATDPVLTYSANPALIAGDSFTGALSRDAGEAVGTYPITQGNLSAGANYTLSYTGADFTIGTNIVTVVAEAKSKVYGDTDPVLTYTVSGLAPGDALTGSLERTAGNNAGTYSITQGTLSAGAGYTINFSSADFTITPKPVTVTANTQSKVYGDADPTLTYSLSSTLVSGDNFSGSLSRAAGNNVGVYAINQGDLALSSNYALTYTGSNLTITPKPITITANTQSKVYGDADPALTYSLSPTLVGSDSFTGALSRAAGNNVGVYAINQGDLVLNSNYALSYTGANLTIIPKAITVTADAKSKSFGAADPVLTYTVNPALVAGDSFTGVLSRTAGEAIGTYAITQGTLSAGTNYTINYTSADFTIGTNIVTVVAEAKSKVYGDIDPVLTYAVSGLAPGDALTGSLVRTAGNNAGTYNITQGSLSAGAGYTINFIGADFTITPKPIGVMADAKSKAFGTADPTLTYTVSGLVGTDALTGSLIRAAGEDVGSYAIVQGTLSAGANYMINFTQANLTIHANIVTITAEAKTKTYGQGDPEFTYTVSGLAPGDTITGNLTRAAGENVGDYAITQGTLSAGVNYTVNFTPASLSIQPKAIDVTAEVKSKVYGDTDPALTYKADGLLAGEKLSGTLSRAGGEHAGSYAITQGTLTAGPNYRIRFTGADFHIEKASLTVTALSVQLCAGSSFPAFAISYSGFKNGDTENSLTVKPGVTTNANANSQPGNYTLTPAGAAAANYTFNYVTGQLILLALPQVSLESNLGIRTAINKGETVQLTAGGGVRYEWYEGSNQLSDQQSALQVRPMITTTYTVKVYNTGGCSEVKTIVITVKDNYDAVKATNLLTPNGDGVNDYWIVSNIDVFPGHEVRIFDRAGRIVYQKKNYDNSWNGMLNGNLLAEGTYYYLIDFGKDKPKLKGFITILRNK